MRFVHLVPALADDSNFYDALTSIARSAAQRLSIELEVIYCGTDRAQLIEAATALARRTPRPDCVLLPNFKGVAHELLPLLDGASIATFVLVEGLPPSDRRTCGEPRTRHARWLGQLTPDDVETGHLLAQVLVDDARARNLVAADGRIHVGVLSGPQSSAAQSRFQGWLALRKERPEVVQASVQYASWEEYAARAAIQMMLRSHPEITVIWAANDAMALGALAGIGDCGRAPGKDVLVGGVDLLPQALRRVEEGAMAVTVGGHVLDGARALVLLYDHFHGEDFEPHSRRSLLEPVTAAEVHAYRRFFEGRGWQKVDFARYSRVKAGAAALPELRLRDVV